MIRSSLLLVAFASCLALGSAACSAPTDTATTEEDVASGVALQPIESSPALVAALAAARAEDTVEFSATTFRYDASSVSDPRRILTAVRATLPYAKLRQDEGAITDAVIHSTLEEYAVPEASDRDAIIAAIDTAVGSRPTTRKFWIRSDDVPDATSEWAEVSLIFVSPKTGTAVLVTIRYDA